MKKYNSEVRVVIFHDAWNLISQVNGEYVSFDRGGDLFVWRNGTICASYDLNEFKRWRIVEKGFDAQRGVWFEHIFLDI